MNKKVGSLQTLASSIYTLMGTQSNLYLKRQGHHLVCTLVIRVTTGETSRERRVRAARQHLQQG